MTPAAIPRDAIKSAKILHISAISQAISKSACDSVFVAIKIAKDTDVTISYDTNLRMSLWPLDRATAIIQHIVLLSDIMLPSFGDAQVLTGLVGPDAICDLYLGLGVGTIAMTLGEQGAMIATTKERKRLKPYKINCLDATGAGDTFNGAFLARIAAGDNVFESGQYANAAALSITGYGATGSIQNLMRCGH